MRLLLKEIQFPVFGCCWEKMKNNKLDLEATIEMIKSEWSDDPSTIEIITDITKECAGATDEDRCEAAL